MFCRSLFVLLSFFLLAIELSVLLRVTASDYLPLVSSNPSCLVIDCCVVVFNYYCYNIRIVFLLENLIGNVSSEKRDYSIKDVIK